MVGNHKVIRYSILVAGEKYDEEEMTSLLAKGVKVIFFGNSEETDQIAETFGSFIDAQFLSVFFNTNDVRLTIVDGIGIQDCESELEKLEHGDERFNLKQYEIEHQPWDKNLLVEAGAGSGKTYVMINRVMYLIHMYEEFDFSRVALITFTNDVADSMREKLTSVLDAKYKLTQKTIYVDLIEKLSEINISTIHSFFRKIIVDVGPKLGYGTNVQLKSFKLEKQEILDSILDERYGNSSERVTSVLGLPLSDIRKLSLEYWGKLDNNGIIGEQARHLDWGTVANGVPANMQNTLVDIFKVVDQKYDALKYEKNAIAMDDIIHELGKIIDDSELESYLNSRYDFIFCDEFQDSDNVQISTISALNRIFSGKLFVVGDIKQSIYRFRGATDSAFLLLKKNMDAGEKERLVEKSLVKNYRTSKDILKELDGIFIGWAEDDLLTYNTDDTKDIVDRLIPTVDSPGIYAQLSVKNDNDRKTQFFKVVEYIRGKKEKDQRIMCITRENWELAEIKNWCAEKKINCLIKEKGSFYRSEAVLDFCALIEAFMYDTEPMYLYNYVRSSYCERKVSEAELSRCEGNRRKLLNILYKAIGLTDWNNTVKELKNKPVMAVLRDYIFRHNPVFMYGKIMKNALENQGYDSDVAKDTVKTHMNQYYADLRKLLDILADHFNGEFCSVTDIAKFIRLKIDTDKEENRAETETNADFCIEGCTAHSSKGLQFDYVILPFMNKHFEKKNRSEILISDDKKRVGWIYYDKNKRSFANDNYSDLKVYDKNETAREETRLLYVALTRAQYGLFCLTEQRRNVDEVNSWSDLLPKEKDNDKSI